MKRLLLLTVILLLHATLFSQTKNFMLGFAGTYPEVNTYGSSSGVNWSWYTEELNLNFWQGQTTINN